MGTSKPRITLTLEPHVYEVLRRLSAAGGESMSSLVTGFLDVAVPPMERMVVVLEQAQSVSGQTREEVRESFLRAEAKLLPVANALMAQNDLFLSEILGVPDVTKEGGKGEPTPVPVNTGVRSGKTPKLVHPEGGV